MKISNLTRLISEDFGKDDQQLVQKLAFVVNPAFEQFTLALNKNLTVEDNLNMQIKELEITVGTDNKPKSATSFKSELKTNCRGVSVIKLENLTSSTTYPSAAPFVSFSESNGQIVIDHVAGLTPNTKYKLRVLALG